MSLNLKKQIKKLRAERDALRDILDDFFLTIYFPPQPPFAL